VYIAEFDRIDEVSVNQFFSRVKETVGQVDFAVNIHSQAHEPELPVGHDIDAYDQNFKTYQRGVCISAQLPQTLCINEWFTQAFLIQRGLLRQMLPQPINPSTSSRGSIVNIVEHGPTPTLVDIPIVAAIAFAIIGMSKTDAVDYAQDKIRVNCIAAGEVLIEKTKDFPGGVPLPRKGTVDDLANVAVWLSAPGSSWLTGLVVPVDGGRSLHHWY
jgi:NAD(P)-dependent dehydrogenase (short-subunit alcohol dehydrogenase family)